MGRKYKKTYKRKEVAAMVTTAAKLRRTPEMDSQKFLQAMDAYINQLKKMPKEQAKKESLAALKRTGVLTENGETKKKIVSWE